jgi:hypothetical protein
MCLSLLHVFVCYPKIESVKTYGAFEVIQSFSVDRELCTNSFLPAHWKLLYRVGVN